MKASLTNNFDYNSKVARIFIKSYVVHKYKVKSLYLIIKKQKDLAFFWCIFEIL